MIRAYGRGQRLVAAADCAGSGTLLGTITRLEGASTAGSQLVLRE